DRLGCFIGIFTHGLKSGSWCRGTKAVGNGGHRWSHHGNAINPDCYSVSLPYFFRKKENQNEPEIIDRSNSISVYFFLTDISTTNTQAPNSSGSHRYSPDC